MAGEKSLVRELLEAMSDPCPECGSWVGETFDYYSDRTRKVLACSRRTFGTMTWVDNRSPGMLVRSHHDRTH